MTVHEMCEKFRARPAGTRRMTFWHPAALFYDQGSKQICMYKYLLTMCRGQDNGKVVMRADYDFILSDLSDEAVAEVKEGRIPEELIMKLDIAGRSLQKERLVEGKYILSQVIHEFKDIQVLGYVP